MLLLELITFVILIKIIIKIVRVVSGAEAREKERRENEPPTVSSLGLNVIKEAEKEAIKNGDYTKAKMLHEIDREGSYGSYRDSSGRERKSYTTYSRDSQFKREVEDQLTAEMNEKLEKEWLEKKEAEKNKNPEK